MKASTAPNEEAFAAHMDRLAHEPPENLTVQDQNQLLTYRSNANFLATRIRAETATIQKSVFTRDIDAGELRGG